MERMTFRAKLDCVHMRRKGVVGWGVREGKDREREERPREGKEGEANRDMCLCSSCLPDDNVSYPLKLSCLS